jgi:cellulose synthase/poly-beta-1,6-N-acetylglucosamine synthase-like glycosyltransferase
MATTQPFPTNSTATVVNQGIDGVFTVAVKLAETAIYTYAPFLNIPVVNTLINLIVEKVGNLIYQHFALFVTFEIIDFQVSGEVNDVQKALIVLKAAQNQGDANALNAALKDFDQAAAALTHIDGSANPGSL